MTKLPENPQLKTLYLDSIFAESEFDLGLFSISHFATLCMIDLKHANMVIWLDEFSREGFKIFEPKTKILRGFLFFSLWIDIVLSQNFFLKKSDFQFDTLIFLKWCPIFDDSTPCLFTKNKNFFWGYWFLYLYFIFGVCILP